MSTVKQIRETIDIKPGKQEAQATALLQQLELGKDQMIGRIEMQMYQVELIAKRVRDKIEAASGCAGETKNKFKTSFEHLRLRLILGVADTRDTYRIWIQRLKSGIAAFEADLDRVITEADAALQAELNVLMHEYVRAVIVLVAEIDAMQVRFNENKIRATREQYKLLMLDN